MSKSGTKRKASGSHGTGKKRAQIPCNNYLYDKQCTEIDGEHWETHFHGDLKKNIKDNRPYVDEYLEFMFVNFIRNDKKKIDIKLKKFVSKDGITPQIFEVVKPVKPYKDYLTAIDPRNGNSYISWYTPVETGYFYLLANLYCHFDEYSKKYPAEFMEKLLMTLEEESITGVHALTQAYHDYLFDDCSNKQGIDIYPPPPKSKKEIEIEYYLLSNTSLKKAYKPSSSPSPSPSSSSSSSTDDESEEELKPNCPYGQNCYRKNPGHTEKYYHGPLKTIHGISKKNETAGGKKRKRTIRKHKTNKRKLNKRKTYKRKYI